MKPLVFATANPHKVHEVKEKLASGYNFQSLADIGCLEEVPETQPTLEGNALQKATYVASNYRVDCFAEDTGLEVEALAGLPGVTTARYAGPQRDAVANMTKLLAALAGESDRRAQFRAVIALVRQGQSPVFFEGIVRGTIAETMRGTGGFGYDPIFIPEGYDQTFAELPSDVKKAFSHRSKAVEQLVEHLASTRPQD